MKKISNVPLAYGTIDELCLIILTKLLYNNNMWIIHLKNIEIKCLLIFLFMLLSTISGISQIPPSELNMTDYSCTEPPYVESTCPNSSPLYNDMEFYLPSSTSNSKIVRLNFFFIHKDDGTGNFIENDPEHQQAFNDIIATMNYQMANLNITDCNGSISDTKIQFVANNYYFINDSYLWNNDNDHNLYKCPSTYNWYLKNKANEIDNDPSISKGIDIFFTCGETAYNLNVLQNDSTQYFVDYACATSPSSDITLGSWVHVPDLYIKFNWMKNWATIINNEPWYPVVYGWFVTTTAKGILHELGHSLDLFPHDYTCTDHNIMDPGKNSVRDYLTTSQIAKMHRSLSLNNTRKFVECTNTNDTWNVTDNSLIDFDIKFFHDVKVNYGATLLITCNASFLKDSKIIVEPGGKLVLDGGLLTNGCEGEFWPGIEVWGDRTRRQIPTYQGWVVMQNGAVIENARFGITTCEKDENGWVVWKKTGGIIHASDCMFRNNYKAVEFLTYPFPQMSFFNNVSFLTSDTWLDPNGYSSDFVSLLDVYGIRFNGCTFANENTDTLFPAPVTSGRGIYSVDAGYTVDQLCLSNDNPCTTSIPSFFGGLYYAIKAENTIPVNTVSIKNSRFVDNCKDVYLSGINFANITRNSFFLPRNNPNSNLYGLYLNNCTGYTVQENSFASQTQNIFASYYGIVVHNSGTDPNEIYNNRFQSLYVAIDAQECNRQNGGLTGLVLKCNDYDNTGYDQVSTTGENPPQDSQKDYLGIALYQGDSLSVTGPAGNTFSVQHSGGESDLYNDVNRFKYYHHFQSVTGTPRVQPDYYINVAVRPTTFEYNKNVCCPSKLGLGGNSNQSIEVMETEINLTNEKQNQLNSLVDGGNTEQTVTDIIFSDPPDALQLRQDLLDNSPYLSDTAMQEAIEKESVLPNEMIRDILVANPHSATSDKVLDMLDERFVPMPDSMMSEILANENIVSAKEDLETEISSHKQAGFQSFYDLVRYYKNDTVSQGSNDSLISLLSSWNYLTAKYQLAMEYLAANDFNSMNNVLASIPGNFILDETEMAKYDAYLSYLNLLKELRSEEKSIFEIDSTQIGLLQEMAEQSSEPVSTYVKNILIANGIIQYDEQVIAPLELKSAKDAKYRKTSSFVQIRYLKLFPNPATRYIIAEYNLKDKASKTGIVTLKISSMYGREIESRQLKKELDQVLIITKDLQEGAYICSLVSEGTVLDQEVFTISH